MTDSLGHYALLEHVGTGGLGELYRARDTQHGRTTAVKVVRPALVRDPAARGEFLQRTALLRELSHPNIASVYDVGDDSGKVFLAVEWVKGEPLKSLVTGHPLKVRRAVDFGAELANALADAHARDHLHGDVTADTVVITPTEHAKLLDYGLAEWTTGGAARRRAAAKSSDTDEATLRAAAYVAPEQVGRGSGATVAAELFSLGVVLYEMLTGRLPFVADSVAGVLELAAASRLTPPSQVNTSVPADLDRIITQALASDPEVRYQSAASLAAELRSVAVILDIREGDREPPTALRRPRRRPRRRSRWPFAVAAIVAAAAAGMFWRGCPPF